MLFAAASPLRHVFAAIHAAVVVPIRAAIAHGMTLMLVMLTALRLTLLGRRGVTLHVVLTMVLGGLSGRGLRGGGGRDQQRDRSDKHIFFHVVLRR
jgi:hypothetical protein